MGKTNKKVYDNNSRNKTVRDKELQKLKNSKKINVNKLDLDEDFDELDNKYGKLNPDYTESI